MRFLSIINLLLNDWASGHRADRDSIISGIDYVYFLIASVVLGFSAYFLIIYGDLKWKFYGFLCFIGCCIGIFILVNSCAN